MIVNLKYTEEKTESIEVSFPTYSASRFPEYTWYHKTYSMEKQIIILYNETDAKFEFGIDKPSLWLNNKDVLLGTGEHKCTKQEFDSVLERAKKFLNSID